MPVVQRLSLLALGPLLDTALRVGGMNLKEDSVDSLTKVIGERIFDRSQRWPEVLRRCTDRAWRTLEIALAGESLWSRLTSKGDERAFRQQIRVFLDSPQAGLGQLDSTTRQACLKELRSLRQNTTVLEGGLDQATLAARAAPLVRFGSLHGLVAAELNLLNELADDIASAGCPNLARIVALRPAGPDQPPLLVQATRYFLRKHLEEDRTLFQGFTHDKLEQLDRAQEQGFEQLRLAVETFGQQLDEDLQQVYDLLTQTHATVTATHSEVLDIKAEVAQQSQQIQELGRLIEQLLVTRQVVNQPLRPGVSLSIHNDDERRLIREVIARYRQLPPDQRQQMPALLNGIGKLEVVAGDFAAAQRDFAAVAQLVRNDSAAAEVEYNLYQSSLEAKQYDAALAALLRAAKLDPQRYEPFPLDKFEPRRILGAGGFGTAFLCRHVYEEFDVVVKTLRLEGSDRNAAEVFREARVLRQIKHPAIITGIDSAYADRARTRPYIVMEYFPGQSLDAYIAEHGVLTVAQMLHLAVQVADGLHAAHQQRILHRDIKPANLLVRADGPTLSIKIIDFGLAMRHAPHHGDSQTRLGGLTQIGSTGIAGTLEYGSPEQLGMAPNVPVSPRSDIYAFAKTWMYGLFKTTKPLYRHWEVVPGALRKLLEQCVEEDPARRPSDFAEVLTRLRQLQANLPTASVSVPATPTTTPAVTAPATPFAPPTPTPAPATVPDWVSSAQQSVQQALNNTPPLKPFAALFEKAKPSQPPAEGPSPLPSPPPPSSPTPAAPPTPLEGAASMVQAIAGAAVAVATSAAPAVASPADANAVGLSPVQALIGHDAPVSCVAVAADGTLAASGDLNGLIVLWDLATAQEVGRLAAHREAITELLWSRDGQTLHSASVDQTVRFWQPRTGKQLRCFDRQTLRALALSGDGQLAISAGPYDGKLRFFAPQTGKEVRPRQPGHTNQVFSLTITDDDKHCASASLDGTVRVWRLLDGQMVRTCALNVRVSSNLVYLPLGVGQGGAFPVLQTQLLAVGCLDGTIRILNPSTGKETRRLIGGRGEILSLRPLPQSQWLAVGHADGTLNIWSLSKGVVVAEVSGHPGGVNSLAALAPGGLLLSGGTDRTVRVWRLS
jgi:WD40 repeat protein/serine/threonine protein kinase